MAPKRSPVCVGLVVGLVDALGVALGHAVALLVGGVVGQLVELLLDLFAQLGGIAGVSHAPFVPDSGPIAIRDQARQVSTSPWPCSITVPGITRSQVGSSRSTPNSGASGSVHCGMIFGS